MKLKLSRTSKILGSCLIVALLAWWVIRQTRPPQLPNFPDPLQQSNATETRTANSNASKNPPAFVPTDPTDPTDPYGRAKSEASRMLSDMKVKSPAALLYIDSVAAADFDNGNTLIIAVTRNWHVEDYQERLQAAQNLEQTWKNYHPGTARIMIVDLNGNKVGATGLTGVWVKE